MDRQIGHRKDIVSGLTKCRGRAAVTGRESIKSIQTLCRRLAVFKPRKIHQFGAETTAAPVLGQCQCVINHWAIVVQHPFTIQEQQLRITDIAAVGFPPQSRYDINFFRASLMDQLQQAFKDQFAAVME